MAKRELPPATGTYLKCKVCSETKDESLFPYSNGRRIGLTCRVCNLAQKKSIYATDEVVRERAKLRAKENALRNPERCKERSRQYREENRDELLKKKREYQQANRDTENKRCREWYQNNKDTEEYKEYKKNYIQANEETISEYHRIRYQNNKELWKAAGKKFRQLNPGLCSFYIKKYHLTKNRSLPKWADLEKIKHIYKNRPEGYAVDHIIPLQGKLVCGLHVDNNLQYLTKSENSSKGNKFDPDTFDPNYSPDESYFGSWPAKH